MSRCVKCGRTWVMSGVLCGCESEKPAGFMNKSHTLRRKTIAQFKKQFGPKWLAKWREYVDGLTGTFSKELLQWRGGREQQPCADIIGVKLSTYRNWEYGRHEPPPWTMPGVRAVMEKNKAPK